MKLPDSVDLRRKDQERQFRRNIFHLSFIIFAVVLGGFLVWKLKTLLLPIVVGALLAYLFRPLKDRFHISWLPHELRVILLFAGVGTGLFLAANKVRNQIPDERQKLELKVRLKYKMNEKFQEIVGTANRDKTPHPLSHLISREAGPMMDQVNRALDLDPDESELFRKYSRGYKGQQPIDTRFIDYFQANQTTSIYTVSAPTRDVGSIEKAPEPNDSTIHAPGEAKSELMEKLSIWILAPLIFIFLGFDNGQMRRYFIGLIPNRYFELSLTVLDMLDDAVGKYLRGTLMECALVGATLTVGLFLLGMPVSVALLIGIVSGLANAIPFLGTAIGLVIALGYSLIAENITPLVPGLNPQDLAIYVVILVGVAHLLDNVVYQPIVLGNAVNLHPLVVIIAIIGGSVMMGVWGMLFAIPTVVVVKTAIETLFKELKDYRII